MTGPAARGMVAAHRVLPFFLLPRAPVILWLCLVGLVYLAWVEVRREPRLSAQWKLWWCLLVFLLNVPGYVALRLWAVGRRRDRAPDAQGSH